MSDGLYVDDWEKLEVIKDGEWREKMKAWDALVAEWKEREE